MSARYAIATHSRLIAATFHEDFGAVRFRELSNAGHHYGLALDTYRPNTMLSKHRSTELIRYSADEPHERIETVPFPGRLKNVHQIAAANGGIYAANTSYNSVVYKNHSGSTHHEYFFNGHKTDINHVNSVLPCGNQVLVLLNNLRKKPSEVAVLTHDPATGFELQHVMSLWHAGCHNLALDGEHLYYNASADCMFVAIDLERQKIDQIITYPGHTKGMSLHGDHLLVGFSEVAERRLRHKSHGYLAVIDRATLTTRKVIDLNSDAFAGPIGNVNEIRCISGGELGHALPEAHFQDWSHLRLGQHRPLSWLMTVGKQQARRFYQHARNRKAVINPK